jgi:hypothetical protein
MRKQWLRLKPIITCLFVAALSGLLAAPTSASPWDFVTRSGSHLMLDGKPFRFSGANVEWLGLIGYGPHNYEPGQIERFPSDYEVNDALATAKEMGATVVRAQTLGDTVGCPNCLEPTLGQFNAHAFRVMDYAVMRARAYGIRLILEFQGDSGAVGGTLSTADVYSGWRGGADPWSESTVIKDEKNHIAQIVDHVNSYTGIPYKDDPTILGWMDCNTCVLWGRTETESWDKQIAAYVKSLDHRHLFISNAIPTPPDSTMLADPNFDVFSIEVYPHWAQWGSGDRLTGEAPVPHETAAQTVAGGKPWFMSEFGWDHTNWQTPAALQTFLTGVVDDPNISGDLWWALEGHANGHGWEPLPANNECDPSDSPLTPDPTGTGCYANEDGNWWALSYTGLTTLSNTAADMAQRAQMLRTHAYQMRGLPTPAHEITPAPIITQVRGQTVIFEGSAGAPDYSIQRYSQHRWLTDCSHCVTDATGEWTDSAAPAGCYRVIPYNLDGVPGPASNTAGGGCPQSHRTQHKRARHRKGQRHRHHATSHGHHRAGVLLGREGGEV